MMEIKAGLLGVVWTGFVMQPPLPLPNNRQDNSLTAHFTPVHFIQPHPAWHLQCAGQQWASMREKIKAFYKYVQAYTQDKRKEGIAIP